jgi:hypothetical protein
MIALDWPVTMIDPKISSTLTIEHISILGICQNISIHVYILNVIS